MKIKLSELRQLVKQEINESFGLSNDFKQTALQPSFQKLITMFPTVIKNQLLQQKMQGSKMDNRTLQVAAEQIKDYVDEVSQNFQFELNALINRQFNDAIENFSPPSELPQSVPQPPASGVRSHERQTVVPSKVS